jgi:hypothetical protein
MKVYGYTIMPDVELAALERMRAGPFTLHAITAEFGLRIAHDAKPTGGDPCAHLVRSDICDRAADRLIQRERKAGHIEIVGRSGSTVWRWREPS